MGIENEKIKEQFDSEDANRKKLEETKKELLKKKDEINKKLNNGTDSLEENSRLVYRRGEINETQLAIQEILESKEDFADSKIDALIKKSERLLDDSAKIDNEVSRETGKEKENDFQKEIQKIERLDAQLQEKQRDLNDIDEQIEELLGHGKNIQFDVDRLEEKMGTIPEKEWFQALKDVENINHDIETKQRKRGEIEKEAATLDSQILEYYKKIPKEKREGLKLGEKFSSVRVFHEHKKKKTNENEDMENFSRRENEQVLSGESQKEQQKSILYSDLPTDKEDMEALMGNTIVIPGKGEGKVLGIREKNGDYSLELDWNWNAKWGKTNGKIDTTMDYLKRGLPGLEQPIENLSEEKEGEEMTEEKEDAEKEVEETKDKKEEERVNEKNDSPKEETIPPSHDAQEEKRREELREKMNNGTQELAKKKAERERLMEEKRELQERSRKYGIELNEDIDEIEKQMETVENDIRKQEEAVQVMQKELEGDFVNNSGSASNNFEGENASQKSSEAEHSQEEKKKREEHVVIDGEYSRVDDQEEAEVKKEETNPSQQSEKGEQGFSPEEFSNRKQRIEEIQKRIDQYGKEKNILQKELNILEGEQKEIEAELSSLEGEMKQEERGGETAYRGTLSVGEIEELKKRREENNRKIQEKKASIEAIQASIQNAQDEQKTLKEQFVADFDTYAGRVSPGEEAQKLLDFFDDAERYRKELAGSLDIAPENISKNKDESLEKTEEKPLPNPDEKKDPEMGDEEGDFLRKLTKDLEAAREAFALDMKNPEKKKKYDEYLQTYNSEIAKRFSDYIDAKDFEQMMRANEIGEQIKIKEALANERLKDTSFMGKAKNMFFNGLEKYRSLPLKQKLAVSAGLIGAGALGGATVGATAVGMTAAGLSLRALSFASSSVGFNSLFQGVSEKLYKKADEKRVNKGMESFGALSQEQKMAQIQNILNQSSSKIADRIEKRKYRDTYIRWGASAASALALMAATRSLGEAAASKIGEWFSPDASPVKISPDYINTPPSDPIVGGGVALDDSSWDQPISDGGGASSVEQGPLTSETSIETITQKIPSQEYIQKHPNFFKTIEGRVWMDNDTELNFGENGKIIGADRNELSLRWGAGGDGLDAKGNYVYDVSKMTSDGSFHKGLSADAVNAIKNGELKAYFTLNSGAQSQLIEVSVGPDGSIVIDPNSPEGKLLFDQKGGRAVFLGHTAEIGVIGEDGKLTVLATHKGPGLDTISETIQREVATSGSGVSEGISEASGTQAMPSASEVRHFDEETFLGSDARHSVKSGDRIWNILEKRTDEFFASRPDITPEQKTLFVDSLKDSLESMSEEELKANGISSGDVDRIFSGRDVIDFAKLFDDDDYFRALEQSGISLDTQNEVGGVVDGASSVSAPASAEVIDSVPEILSKGDMKPFGEIIGSKVINEENLKSLGPVGQDIWKYIDTSLERNYIDVNHPSVQDTLRALAIERMENGDIRLVSEGETSFRDVMSAFDKDVIQYGNHENFFQSLSHSTRDMIDMYAGKMMQDPEVAQTMIADTGRELRSRGVSPEHVQNILSRSPDEQDAWYFRRILTQRIMTTSPIQ